MFRDITKLRVFQVKKSEEKYAEVVQHRIQRLESWKPRIKQSKLKKDFNRSIKLTREGQRVAERLFVARNGLVKKFPYFDNLSDALDSVITVQKMGLKENPRIKELSKYPEMQEGLMRNENTEAQARMLVLEMLEGKVKEDISALDLINKRYAHLTPLELANFKVEFYLQHSGVEFLVHCMTACRAMVETVDLYRGLFYMGIVNIEGGKLDQKVLTKHILDISGEAASFIPIVGNAMSLVKITKSLMDAVQEFRGVDSPDLIEDASWVEQFLSRYEVVLKSWQSGANVYILSLESMANLVGIYQPRKTIAGNNLVKRKRRQKTTS